MKRKIIDNFYELLKQHGITFLTSEACGAGLRGLFDLNSEGQELLEEALGGMQANYPGWNDWEGKSAMLFHEMIRPLTVHVLLGCGADVVVDIRINDNNLIALYEIIHDVDGNIADPEYQKYLEALNRIYQGKFRVYWRSGTARNGMRNRHVMSDRIE